MRGNPSLLMQWDYSQADAAPVIIFVKEQIKHLRGTFFNAEKSSNLKQLLEELGIETEEDSLVIQRDISASGKNVCRDQRTNCQHY